MSDLFFWGGVFVVSLTALIFAADKFIKASERIGLAWGIPPFVIGVTLVALGTSLPELITSILAVSADSSEIVLGNVIGSNISNLCLILGLTSILARKIVLKYDIMGVDMPMVVGSAFLLGLMIIDGDFHWSEGVILLFGMLLYLGYVFASGREKRKEQLDEEQVETGRRFHWSNYLILVLGGATIFFAAAYNVDSIIRLSELLGIGKEFISLTVVSLGTSLPELVVSIAAVRTKNTEIAVGNVLGSNIFNVFAVMGIPSLFGEIFVPASILTFSLPLMIGASLMVFFIVQTRSIDRWAGWILVLFYVFFISNLIIQAV